LIPAVAQNALDLNYDGLMIEVHSNPDAALSDREQQLTPQAFLELIDSLIIRKEKVDDRLFLSMLEELRDRIDSIDENILVLIAERMNLARNIGQYKKENNMTIFQVERWNEILLTRQRSGSLKDLDLDFIFRLYSMIHDESIRLQTGILNSTNIPKETE
jgi:chorismate mutase